MVDETAEHEDRAARQRLKSVAVRVIVVQIITLALLWFLQSHYSAV